MSKNDTVLVQIGKGSSKVHLTYRTWSTAFCGAGGSVRSWGGRVRAQYEDNEENRKEFAAILCRRCFPDRRV